MAKPGPEPRSSRLNLLPYNSLQPTFFWNTQTAVGSASWSKRGAHPALCFPTHGAPGQAQVKRPLERCLFSLVLQEACLTPESRAAWADAFPGQWLN